MNRYTQLIYDQCPNGVEYRKIKDVFRRLKGTPITAGKMKEIENPNGNIKIFAGGKTVINANEEDIPNANITRVPAVLVQSRGIIDVVYYDQPFTFKNEMWAYTNENKITVRYLYYYLKKNIERFREAASGMGSLPQISLPVTEAELEAQLHAELEARRKQYEHYRDVLLSFDMNGGGTTNCQWKELGEIGLVTKLAGFEFTNYVSYSDSGKIIALRGLNVKNGKLDLNDVKYIDNSDLSKLSRSKLILGDMLFTYVGTIGQVALIDKNDTYYLAPNVALIRIKKEYLLPRFVMYFFQTKSFWSNQIDKLLQSSSMKNIPMEKIRKFKLPIPPISEQTRIVSILDRFDALCNDITQGLPAEIEARRKQYEYYRDKLLTFQPLA